MEEAIRYAKKYLEDLLSFFGLNVDVHASHDDDVIELNIPSTHLNGFLIGQRGDTIRALQYMVSSALLNNNFENYRVNVDVADYKKAQNNRLAERVEQWAADVKSSGKDMELQPMNPAFRRIVHKVASDNGLETESIGERFERRVVIKARTELTPEDLSEDTEVLAEPAEVEAQAPVKKQPTKPQKTKNK